MIPRIQSLPALVTSDPDLTPALHREDIVWSKRQFSLLQDDGLRARFNIECLSLFRDVSFTIISVVIDKPGHRAQYRTAEHPYHYCFTRLLERYVGFLMSSRSQGDVLVEARGKREDRTVAEVYRKFYELGSAYSNIDDIQNSLTPKEVKIFDKRALAPGLELADLLAHGAKQDVLHAYGRMDRLPAGFGSQVMMTVQAKYLHGKFGPKGFGKILV